MDSVKNFSYVLKLAKFAFSKNRFFYLSICLSLFSAGIELIAMTSLFPLFEMVSGADPNKDGFIARILAYFQIPLSALSFLLVFLGLFIVRIVTQLLEQTLSLYLGKRIMAQLCSGAFNMILKSLPISEVNEKSMGFYISLAGDESFRASTLIISLTKFISSITLAILYFIAIAKFSPTTAYSILVFSLFAAFAFFKVAKFSHQLGSKQMQESRSAGSLFLDALNNLKAVRAFSAEQYVVGVHRNKIFNYAKTLFWVDELTILTKLLPILLLLIVFGGWLIWNEQALASADLAFMVTLIVYLMRFFPIVGQGISLLMKIASDAKSGKDVTNLISNEEGIDAFHQEVIGGINSIELKDVSFSYFKDGSGEVLSLVNLEFIRGRSYALIGKSGVGKSTLIDLILKFYHPTDGEILVNGISYSQIAEQEIRKKIILINQEPSIFDDSVANNISLGLDTSLQSISNAAKLACIDEIIMGMGDGYKTRLQYQGQNLSGGQRQRIAIARALLRKADVIIFDESTSALDKATQQQVVDNIFAAYAEKIIIFVTHDPLIMNRVDQIIDVAKINKVNQFYN